MPTSLEAAVPPAVLEDNGVLAEEDEEGIEVPNLPPDVRIRWVHFLLGCAVLLPWNGAQPNVLQYKYVLRHALDSVDNGHALLPLTARGLFYIQAL